MKRQRRKQALTKRLEKNTTNTLERNTRKLVSKANARLNSLNRRFSSGTWASKRLMQKLSSQPIRAWSKGRIKIKKNVSRTQLIAINKAVSNFLASETSTKKGIERVRQKQIEEIQNRLSVDATDMSYEDAEFFYEMRSNNDYAYFSEKMGDSALQACIQDAIENGDSEDEFLTRLEWYGSPSMNDLDTRERAIRLYEKYVK